MAADGLQDAERFGVETHGGTLESEQGTAVVGLLGMPQTVGQGDVLLDISQGRVVVVGTVQLIEVFGLFHAPLGIALLQIDCARTAYLRLVVGHELRRLLYGLVYLLVKFGEGGLLGVEPGENSQQDCGYDVSHSLHDVRFA